MHIDLDVPAPVEEPRRRPLFAAFAAVALLAVSVAIYMVGRPPPTALIVDPRPVWTADTGLDLGDPVHAEAHGGTVLVITKRGLFALDRFTGERRWRLGLTADELMSTPEAAVAAVRVVGETVLVRRTGRTQAIDLATGAVRYELPDGRTFIGTRVVTTMTCADGCVLTGYAIVDGARLWRRDFPGAVANAVPDDVDTGRQSRETVADNLSPLVPLIPGETWVVLTVGDSTDVVDLADGGTWEWDRAPTAQYAVVGEYLFDVTDKAAVEGVNPMTGARLWSTTLLDPTWTTPILTDHGLLDAPLYDGDGPAEFQLVDPTSGAVTAVPGDAPALCVGGGTVVRLSTLMLEGTPLSGGPPWIVHLGSGELTLVKWVTGDGRFVLDALVGDVHRVWIVDLATGVAGGFSGQGGVVGYSDGALITSSYRSMSGSYGVEFYELAR